MKYLGFVARVLSAYVMAEEVDYCSDTHNHGLQNNKLTGVETSKNKFRVMVPNDGRGSCVAFIGQAYNSILASNIHIDTV